MSQSYIDDLVKTLPAFGSPFLPDQHLVDAAAAPDGTHLCDVTTHPDFIRLASDHLVILASSLSVTVSSGPGIFGSKGLFVCGWSHSTASAPSSKAKYRKLVGYRAISFGGASDPQRFSVEIPCEFKKGISKMLKPAPPYGGSPRFHWFLEVEAWGPLAASGTYVTVDCDLNTAAFGQDMGL